MWTLAAVLFPALLLPVLLAVTARPHVPRLWQPGTWPAELWVAAIAGLLATIAGVLDWRFHRRGGRTIPRAEHRAELLALSLGMPLFALLAAASVVEQRGALMVPTVAVALVMAGAIAFDETRFHRACGRYETLLHRLLVGGNGLAFLAWFHWCFAPGASAA